VNPWRDILSVRLGEYAVARGEGRLAALGLGSCIAVLLHDGNARVGGLVHVVLPDRSFARDTANPAKFADVAVPFLVDQLRRAGAVPERLTARLVGGACMFRDLLPPNVRHMGQRNLEAVRAALDVVGVPVVGEDVGDDFGRSVVFDVAQGTATVRTVGRGERRV